MDISVIIPTLNASSNLQNIFNSILTSTIKPCDVIIIDSSSDDDTVSIALQNNAKVVKIAREEFNNGLTRSAAAHLAQGDILIFLTQDVLPANQYFLERLIYPIIVESDIGASYGRQIPCHHTGKLSAFDRMYNYPSISRIKGKDDVGDLGIKTVFLSNSFAAYRRVLWDELGGFPCLIFAEDVYMAATMIRKGYRIAYVSEAQVYHSHDYTLKQEFKRYFDIGVFYGREDWIIKLCSRAESEGIRFMAKQLKYIVSEGYITLLPKLVLRNVLRYIGYQLGLKERLIPLKVKINISMHKNFWRNYKNECIDK